MSAGDRRPLALLALGVLTSVALLLALGAGNTFFQDTWAYLIERPGTSAGDFLRPHNEHIVVIPVALQKLLLALFGLESAAFPERVALTATVAATAVLLFLYVRRRAGDWAGLIAAVIVLFLGAGWEVLLWPFEISLAGSMLTGLGMLLALDREDRAGDLAACALLAASIAFSSLGVAFVAAAAVDVAVRFRDRGLARAYVAAVPLVLYAAWYLGYGHESRNSVSIENAVHAPRFIAEGLGASLGAILGLWTLAGNIHSIDGRTLALLSLVGLAAICVGIAVWEYRSRGTIMRQLRRATSAGLWPVVAATLAFWGLTALNSAGRLPVESRYMYIGAILLLMVAANLLTGVAIPRRALAAAGALTAVVVALNLVPLFEGDDYLAEQTTLTRADLAALEIARDDVYPGFGLSEEVAGTPSMINVVAGRYLELEEEHGSPAYTPDELADAPEEARRQADILLAAALPISISTKDGVAPAPAGTKCRRLAPGRELALAPGVTTVLLRAGGPGTLSLRRFAVGEYPKVVGDLPAPSKTTIEIPADESSRPWRLRLDAGRPARACS